MSPSELRFIPILAEIAPKTAGQITGSIIGILIPLLGAAKCWSISKRPATNSKCAIGLMLLLIGWAGLSFGGLLVRLFPNEQYLLLITGVPAGLSILVACVLGVIGLVELSQKPGVFTQGRAQAVWTLVLAAFLISSTIYGAIARSRTLFPPRHQPTAGQDLRVEEYNFRFTAPGRSWMQTDISRINRHAKLGFIRYDPVVYFIIIPEKLPSSFDVEQLEEISLNHMKNIADNVRVISRREDQTGDLSGIRLELEARLSGQHFTYINWLCVTNGWAYQLLAWGEPKNRSLIADEFHRLRQGFAMIDPAKSAPRGGTSPTNDFSAPNWNFTFRWKDSDWRPFSDLATQVPIATFGAEHIDNAAMFVASISLMELEAHDPIMHKGMLATFGFQLGTDVPVEQKEIQQGGYSGIEVIWRKRSETGDEYTYRGRVLRNNQRVQFAVVWVETGHPKGNSILNDAFGRLEFGVGSPAAPDSSRFSDSENRTHLLALNSIGLTYHAARQYDRSASYFEAALRRGHVPAESPVLDNLITALIQTGKHREALTAIDTWPALLREQPELQARRAFLLGELGEPGPALFAYSELFSTDFRDDAAFRNYVTLLAQTRHPTNALPVVEKYLQSKDSIEIRLLQSQLHQRVQDYDKAIETLVSQRRKHPFNDNLASGLAEAYLAAGRFTEALAISREMVKTGEDSAYAHYLSGRSQVGLKWYREAKESFEAAAKKAPANSTIKEYLDHVSGLLGEGANTALKNPVPPVAIPDSFLSPLPAPPAGFAKDHGAYYDRRITAVSFEKGKESKTTTFLRVRTLNAAGVSAFSSFQFPFDPLAEEIFVNRMEVFDNTGLLVSTGRVADYYLLDDTTGQLATQRKVANIPVPGLQPGHTVELTLTRRELGRAEEFTFLSHTMSGHIPVREEILFLTGETNRIKFAASPGLQPQPVQGGMSWRMKNLPVYRWEPLQPPFEDFLPTIWIADSGVTWAALASNYLHDIKGRLEPSTAQAEKTRALLVGLKTRNEKIRTISHYVQTNFTYKAIEFGRRARVPLAVDDIVRNRYGDCKDHSLLTKQMLEAAGIPASLALVNSRRPLRGELPSLDQFDHMIVHVPGPEGVLFLDCTAKDNDLLADAPAGLAGRESLILDRDQPRFAVIPPYATNANTIRSVRQLQVTNTTDLVVNETLTYHGIHGSHLRRVLAGQTVSQRRSILMSYLKPVGTHLSEFDVDNLDRHTEPLILRMTYLLKSHFHRSGAEFLGNLPCFFELAYLQSEPVEKRESPFERTIPITFHSEISMSLPSGGQFKALPVPAGINNRFMRCRFETTSATNRIDTRFTAAVNTGRLAPADYADYHSSVERALGLLAQNVSFTTSAAP